MALTSFSAAAAAKLLFGCLVAVAGLCTSSSSVSECKAPGDSFASRTPEDVSSFLQVKLAFDLGRVSFEDEGSIATADDDRLFDQLGASNKELSEVEVASGNMRNMKDDATSAASTDDNSTVVQDLGASIDEDGSSKMSTSNTDMGDKGDMGNGRNSVGGFGGSGGSSDMTGRTADGGSGGSGALDSSSDVIARSATGGSGGYGGLDSSGGSGTLDSSSDETDRSSTGGSGGVGGSGSSAASQALKRSKNSSEIVGSDGAHSNLALECVDGSCSIRRVGKNGTSHGSSMTQGTVTTKVLGTLDGTGKHLGLRCDKGACSVHVMSEAEFNASGRPALTSNGTTTVVGPHVTLNCASGSCSVEVSGLNKTNETKSKPCLGCNRYLMTVEQIKVASAKGAECVYDPDVRLWEELDVAELVNSPLDSSVKEESFALPADGSEDRTEHKTIDKAKDPLELISTRQSTAAGFYTGGLREAGDSVKLSSGFDGAMKMKLANNYSLSYGDILSLCGDFYGNAEKGVISSGKTMSEREERFKAYTWGCLEKDQRDPNRLFPVATNERLLDAISMPEHCSTYSELASADFDHFAALEGYSFEEQGNGFGAWEAYSAGHSVACKTATAGKGKSDELQTALMQNACASHFLSELFASGHMRTPRRFLGRATSFWMATEDNQWGLNVSNKNGDTWRAYGDTCHAEKANSKNKELEVASLIASAEAVLQAWKDGNATACQADYRVDNLRPDLKLVQDPKQAKAHNNGAPMFVPYGQNKVSMTAGNLTGASVRGSICGMDHYHHTFCWDWRTVYDKIETGCPVSLRGEKPFQQMNCHDPAY